MPLCSNHSSVPALALNIFSLIQWDWSNVVEMNEEREPFQRTKHAWDVEDSAFGKDSKWCITMHYPCCPFRSNNTGIYTHIMLIYFTKCCKVLPKNWEKCGLANLLSVYHWANASTESLCVAEKQLIEFCKILGNTGVAREQWMNEMVMIHEWNELKR